jgi:hypothetical protein
VVKPRQQQSPRALVNKSEGALVGLGWQLEMSIRRPLKS